MLKNIKQNAKIVDIFIKKYFNTQKYSELVPVMKYGTLFGGKKIRSTIIFNTSKIFNIRSNQIINLCAAVECIHSYSLIHDDLPCMDNDTLRRGKPSTHIKFGESTAILAGNSLLTLAFEIIADKKFNLDSKVKLNLIRKLSECAGHVGIAGGQFLDLDYEKKKINFKAEDYPKFKNRITHLIVDREPNGLINITKDNKHNNSLFRLNAAKRIEHQRTNQRIVQAESGFRAALGSDECASNAQTLQSSNPIVLARETEWSVINHADVYNGKIAPSLCEVLCPV